MSEKPELVPVFDEVVFATPERGLDTPGTMDQMRVWAEAFEAWISSRGVNTQRAYRKAWENLLDFTGKSPWQIGRAEMQDWVKLMRENGLGASTVALKKYCRKAGLDAKKIHVHTLRHTGAMLRIKIGESMQEVSKDLAHANIATTQIHLDHVQGHQDSYWQKVAVLLAD